MQLDHSSISPIGRDLGPWDNSNTQGCLMQHPWLRLLSPHRSLFLTLREKML